jgi:hypothetical protein
VNRALVARFCVLGSELRRSDKCPSTLSLHGYLLRGTDFL